MTYNFYKTKKNNIVHMTIEDDLHHNTANAVLSDRSTASSFLMDLIDLPISLVAHPFSIEIHFTPTKRSASLLGSKSM